MNTLKKMTPRRANEPLRVLVLGRVSTAHQQISNIEAGYRYAESVLKSVYDGEPEIRRLGEQASGMATERRTIMEATELIEAGWPDLVLMEDVSKSYRNPRWIYAFVQDCVDADIRVIAPGDIAKVPELTPIIHKLFEMVTNERRGGAALAAWLNEQPDLPRPPYAKRQRWTSALVLNLLRDPILYGLRQFVKVRHEPRFRDGKHKRIRNANPLQDLRPELAHLTKVQWDAMQIALNKLGGHVPRCSGADHPRYRVPSHQSVVARDGLAVDAKEVVLRPSPGQLLGEQLGDGEVVVDGQVVGEAGSVIVDVQDSHAINPF